MYILGAGGFAREVALVLFERGVTIEGYLCDDPKQWKTNIAFGPVVGSMELQNTQGYKREFMPGIGSPDSRKNLVERALALGWTPIDSVISPRAHLPSSFQAAGFELGKGSVICSGVSATVNIKVGDFVNVNLNCTLGHDCVLENYVNLSPDVNISGYVHLEEEVDIGTGAVIGPKVRIGRRSVIGAGSTVLKDVPPGEVWVGSPAKFLRTIG